MEDWQKKYYSNKMNGVPMPHEQPQPVITQRHSSPSNGEINLENELMSRLAGKMQNSNGNQNGFMPPGFVSNNNNGPKQVELKIGKPFYREIQTGGFGSVTPLVKESGTILENISKNVFYKKEKRAFIVDNTNSIDLGNIANHPEKIIDLCEIEIPFVGKILVTRDSIIESHSSAKQLLKG